MRDRVEGGLVNPLDCMGVLLYSTPVDKLGCLTEGFDRFRLRVVDIENR